MQVSWLGLCLAAVLGAQDDSKPLKDEAAKAVRLTWANGGFHFAGSAKGEADEEDADDEPSEFSIAGDVAPSFNVAAKATVDRCTHELYKREGKYAGRSTWRGSSTDWGSGRDELLSLLDFQKLSAAIDKATVAKAQADEKVGSADCRSLALTLPGEAIRGYSEEEDDDEESPVEAVEMKLWIAKSGGLVQRIEATIRRNYKDDGYKSKSTCALTLSEHGSAKVVYPADVLKLLGE
jgi:hypothetical protein